VVNLTIQLFICIDFYLTLKNPFYPRQRRGRCQSLIQFLIFLTVIGMYLYVIQSQSVKTYESMNLFLFVAKIIMVFLGWIFILLSL